MSGSNLQKNHCCFEKKKKTNKKNLQTICAIQNQLKLFKVDEHETKEKEKNSKKLNWFY